MTAIRIDYHKPERLDLITGPLKASFDALREENERARIFFRSGWKHGPHVNLCVLGETVDDDSVERECASLKQWVAQHPSNAALSEEEYLANARKLGSLEGVDGPYLPLNPDNTVEIVTHSPPRLVDGHDVLQPAYLEYLSDTAPLLFALAALKKRNGHVANLVLMAMLAATASHYRPFGIERGFISLRAHADFFFANFDSTGKVRQRFDAIVERSEAAVDDAIGPAELIGRAEGERAAVRSILRPWPDILERTRTAVEAAADEDSGWFSYTPVSFPEQQDEALMGQFHDAGLTGTVNKGETLEAVYKAQDAGLDTSFFSSREFQVFRILINMFYSILPPLGVSPAERFGLCHLVASAVERGLER